MSLSRTSFSYRSGEGASTRRDPTWTAVLRLQLVQSPQEALKEFPLHARNLLGEILIPNFTGRNRSGKAGGETADTTTGTIDVFTECAAEAADAV